MKMTSLICILLAFCTMGAGCSNRDSGIEGKWAGKTGVLEFKKDHTGVINPPEGTNLPKNVQFKWTREGSDVVRVDIDPPVEKTFFGKLISKKELVLEDDKFIKQ